MKHLVILSGVVGLGLAAWAVRGRAVPPAPAPVRSAPPVARPEPVRSIDEFQSEARRRREPLAENVASASDPAARRKAELDLARLDLELEIEGLLIKRTRAEQSGDARGVAEIDRLLELKRSRLALHPGKP